MANWSFSVKFLLFNSVADGGDDRQLDQGEGLAAGELGEGDKSSQVMTDRILHQLIYISHIKQDKNLVQHTFLAVQGAEALPLSLELISVVALSGLGVDHDPRVDPGVCLTFCYLWRCEMVRSIIMQYC